MTSKISTNCVYLSNIKHLSVKLEKLAKLGCGVICMNLKINKNTIKIKTLKMSNVGNKKTNDEAISNIII